MTRTLIAALSLTVLLGGTSQLLAAQVASPPAAARRSDTATAQQARPRAISHSDFYYKRLAVHRVASYAMLPLVAGEFVVGNQLLHDDDPASWMKSTHSALATSIGVVFGVNTITGVWNLWESRRDPGNNVRKYVHAALLLASDAGFVLTAGAAPESEEGENEGPRGDARRHRDLALSSVAVSAVGTVMMWLWK